MMSDNKFFLEVFDSGYRNNNCIDLCRMDYSRTINDLMREEEIKQVGSPALSSAPWAISSVG